MGLQFDRKKFFDAYRKRYGGLIELQVSGLESLLTGIENDPAIIDVRWAAYMLATVKHECADEYHPLEEFGKGRGKRYGIAVGDHVYYGRGYVQLTWGFNYKNLGAALGVDLYNHPELALDPNIAYQVMSYGMRHGTFTGKDLSDFIRGGVGDYSHARKIINGLDKADLIAGYAEAFEAMLTRAQVQPGAARGVLPSLPTLGTPEEKPEPAVTAVTADPAQLSGKEQVAIESHKPVTFTEYMWAKVSALFGGNLTFAYITQQLQQFQSLGIGQQLQLILIGAALFFSVVIVIVWSVSWWRTERDKRKTTDTLVAQNSTPNNDIHLISSADVPAWQQYGATVIRRPEGQ